MTLTETERNRVIAMLARKGFAQDVIDETMGSPQLICDQVHRATGLTLKKFLEET